MNIKYFLFKSNFSPISLRIKALIPLLLIMVVSMYPGGGTVSDGKIRSIPELDGIRPEFFQFGKVVPAFGVYARHVKGLSFDNMQLNTEIPDDRPAIIIDDVVNFELSDSKASVTSEAECMIRLQNVRQAWIRNCLPVGNHATFLQVEGEKSSNIYLQGMI